MRRPLALLAATVTAAALLAGCGGSSDGGSTTTAAPTTTTKPTYADIDATDITFHAVEQILACDGGVPSDASSTTAAPEDTVPGIDGALCYVLGPEAGTGADVQDAKVYADGVAIQVTVRDEAVDAMNELFDACYAAAESCPASSKDGRGYVAIVVDGRVISTPAIDGEGIASSPFLITGDFDKAQATAIADAINA